MAKGDLPTAERRFSESLKLDPAVGTLLNLAACEEKQGKLASALAHFTNAKAQLPADDFRVGFTTERITSLSARVAKIIIKLTAASMADARITKDGAVLAQTQIDSPLVVDPGAPHVFVYEAPGLEPNRVEVTLKEGETQTIELGPRRAKPAPRPDETIVPPPAAAASEMSPRRTWAWVTGGAALAGIATGTITGIMTISAANTYKDNCDPSGECEPAGLDAAERGRTLRVVSPVAFAVGIAFGIASTYLFVTSSSSSSSSKKSATTTANGFILRF